MRETRGWTPDRQLYFAIRFSQPLTSNELYNRQDQPILYNGFKTPGNSPATTQSIEGRGLIAVFDFAPGQPLITKVAISPVSEDNAIANMDAQVPTFDFNAVRTAATTQWRQALGALDITADRATTKSLYTAMYHALLSPSLSMDVNGEYRGPDNQVHKATNLHFVSSLSLWDAYRAEQPLMTLLQPASRTSDLANSLIASQHESRFGILPVWQFQGIESWCMIGYHAVPILADAIAKNIPGFDQQAALKAMVASATYAPYGNLGDYIKLGYVPVDHDEEAASKTVEYAFDDWTIAQTALKLNEKNRQRLHQASHLLAQQLQHRRRLRRTTLRQRHLPNTLRSNQSRRQQWLHRRQRMAILLVPTAERTRPHQRTRRPGQFSSQVRRNVRPESRSREIQGRGRYLGMIGQYIHGNEPSHHLPYLYMYAGQPWRTQARLKQIVDTQYKPTTDGLVGNDDLGQMSAWLVFTSLGFYPVAPGSNQYVLGRPFVDRAVLHLPNNKTLTITADHLSNSNAYVQSITLNNKPIDLSYITHEEIMAGGELRFTMSPKD